VYLKDKGPLVPFQVLVTSQPNGFPSTVQHGRWRHIARSVKKPIMIVELIIQRHGLFCLAHNQKRFYLVIGSRSPLDYAVKLAALLLNNPGALQNPQTELRA